MLTSSDITCHVSGMGFFNGKNVCLKKAVNLKFKAIRRMEAHVDVLTHLATHQILRNNI
jgi:hypothetical protein